MGGKMVRNPAASQPGALAFLALIGLAVSACLGALAVLWKAHLLSVHTPWARVPGALWAVRAMPIVWQPFLVGFGLGVMLSAVMIVASMFKSQKLHGEARWANIGETRKGNLLAEEGIFIGKTGGKIMRFGGNEHMILEAPTRAGKGVAVVIPNLLQWEGSVVVLDVKQENWDLTAGFRAKQLKQQVLIFNPLDSAGRTARYNPFSYIDRRDSVVVINELQKIAAMLFPLPMKGDPFWAESARTAFLGVAAYVAATADDGDDALPFTIGEIYRQLAAGDAKKRFPRIIRQREKDGQPLSEGCVSALRDWFSASDNTFTSITKSVTAKINLWLNPIVDAATSESDFDLRDFRDQRISLYLGVTPDDLERVAPIYNLLFQQLIDLNVRSMPGGGRHPIKLLLLLDEFARLGRASIIASGFSYVAGYGIRLLPVIQSRAQLREVYGNEITDEIAANCGVELVFRPRTNAEAKEISERLGTYTFTARSRSMGGRGGGSVSDSDQRRPLLLPQEVILIPEDDLIVLRSGIPPVVGRKVRYYKDKGMTALTQIATPPIPHVKPDPNIARNSFRVIAAAEAEAASAPVSGAGGASSTLNPTALAAAHAAPEDSKVATLFNGLLNINQFADAGGEW